MNKAVKLISSLAISFSVAAIGSLATIQNIPTWYAELCKPPFNPPNWLFGPVWTVLYTLMGVGLWLVWTAKAKRKNWAYWAFGVQLALNTLWSLVFFGLHQVELAGIIIFLLLAAILWMIYEFRQISKLAAYLQVPYLLWVSFATLLNLSIAVLN